MKKKIEVGVSSCLFGEKVRHDGCAKRQRYITDQMAKYIDFYCVCPEVEIGLGVPRPTIRLIKDPKKPNLVFVKDHSIDITNEMQTYADQKVKKLSHLAGYIFKRQSPSCGPSVKVYQQTPKPPKMGKGLFYQTFTEKYPNCPAEDEGRLNDPAIRENFIERIYLYNKWLKLVSEKCTPGKIVSFHTEHKLSLMSHNVAAHQRLGQMVANMKKMPFAEFKAQYITELMAAFKLIATHKKHSNVLHHCMGYLKNEITALDKKELVHTIEQYRLGKLPLVVPITLLRHHFMHHPNEYIQNQSYLTPYPDELMLRNAV